MVLIIDNYDSFSYNLYQLIGDLCGDVKVVRNDKVSIPEIISMNPAAIVISPGPGRPAHAGISEEAVRILGGSFPILGVCLGHQAICEGYGATVTYARKLMHGKQSVAKLRSGVKLFEGLGEETPVARYHSLAADRATIPDCLEIIAETDDGEVMAVRHREYKVYGVQFHPESILTPEGKKMLSNFLKEAGAIN